MQLCDAISEPFSCGCCNRVEFECNKIKGHAGPHSIVYDNDGTDYAITWEKIPVK